MSVPNALILAMPPGPCPPHNSCEYQRTGRSDVFSPVSTAIYNNHQQQRFALKSCGPLGPGLPRSGIDSAVDGLEAHYLGPISSARSISANAHKRWPVGRVGLNHQKCFLRAGQVSNKLLRKGSSAACPRLIEQPRRKAPFTPIPSSSSAYRMRRNELSSFFGITVQIACRFSDVSCVAWIPASMMNGRNRWCTVQAEMAHDVGRHRERRVKHEIHGRRTRVGRPKPYGPYENIMLQGFNWESHKGSTDGRTWWQVLKSQAEELCVLGVTDIWLPPASQSVDKQGYLPGELYNLDSSKYGTGVQLKELIDELHTNGISVIADIVINHRSGKLQDNKGHWNVFKGGNRDKRLDWGPWAVVDDDMFDSGGKGHHDTGESYGAAPDLDHTNKQVQDELTDWMNWLKAEIGFDGWRFDFVKGYAPEYAELYFRRTNPTIAVGELWTSMAYYEGQLSWDQNNHRQQLCNWIDGTHGACCAFDFTTKGILQRSVENELWRLKDGQGKPPGLIGWWPQKAVTFLDNHDTGSTQRHWAFPDKKVMQGYAYILTHPGIPCIFYDHIYCFKLNDEIKKLLDLRKRHRINAVSTVNIQKAEGDIYVAKIDNRVILKLGPRYDMASLLPGKDLWTLTLTGPDYAIWETTAPLPSLLVPPASTKDQNQVTTQLSRPTQPVHITSKMSGETRSRILKEIPELVDNIDAGKEKPTR